MNIEAVLGGGNPRSLGKTDEIVKLVLQKPATLPELFECLFASDEIVRMRAGDALEKVCRERPEWFEPFIDRLLDEIALIDQPSVQWHLVQMLGEVELSTAQKSKAVAILKRNLEHATDWIVLNYSLEVCAQFARQDAALRDYFIEQLKRYREYPLKSVAKRAAKLSAEFGG